MCLFKEFERTHDGPGESLYKYIYRSFRLEAAQAGRTARGSGNTVPVEASMAERLKAVEGRLQRLSDLIDADAIERKLNEEEGEKQEMGNDPIDL